MWQRLNTQLELWDIKVNAYYHWSGYTKPWFKEVMNVVKANKNTKEKDPIVRLVSLLESTWASLTIEELQYAREHYPKIVSKLKVDTNVNRNSGLISISPEWVEETIDWQEASSIIKFDEDFNIISIDISDLFWIHEQDDDDDSKYTYLKDVLEWIDIHNVKEDQLEQVEKFLDSVSWKNPFNIKWNDTVYCIIA